VIKAYTVCLTTEYEIQIDDKAINEVDDDWRKTFYAFNSLEDIVAHITYNLARGWNLSDLDGWATHQDSEAFIVFAELVDVDVMECPN
jgi:hypothetical protein